jgi:thioredoxin 1
MVPDGELDNHSNLVDPASGNEVLLFTGPDCGVCDAIRPRLEELLRDRFPRMHLQAIRCDVEPEKAATWDVREVPTIVIRFEGAEIARFVRYFSLGQVAGSIGRPYEIFYD